MAQSRPNRYDEFTLSADPLQVYSVVLTETLGYYSHLAFQSGKMNRSTWDYREEMPRGRDRATTYLHSGK
jgi:hypothetical protein